MPKVCGAPIPTSRLTLREPVRLVVGREGPAMPEGADRGKRPALGTEAAERVADVLVQLSRADGPIGVSALARELDLSKAVVYRILQSLASRDLVRVDSATRQYHLGASAVALGVRALRQLDLKAEARDELIALRNRTEETTTLSLLVVDTRTYIDQVEGPQEIKMTVELGRHYPLYAGASSRAILAFLPAPEVQRVLEHGMIPLTDETIREPADLLERLARVRAEGIATSRGERQSGAGSVAAPIFQSGSRVIGSISVCGPIARFDSKAIAAYIPLVTEAAERISRRMSSEQG